MPLSFLGVCSYPVVGVVDQFPGSTHLRAVMREAVQRGLGRPGRLLILYVGTGHAFQGRGRYAVKMSVKQVKETPGDENPFKGNSKTKA